MLTYKTGDDANDEQDALDGEERILRLKRSKNGRTRHVGNWKVE